MSLDQHNEILNAPRECKMVLWKREELGEEMKLGMRLNNQLAYKLHV